MGIRHVNRRVKVAVVSAMAVSPLLVSYFPALLNPCSAEGEEAGWEEGRGKEGAEMASGRAFRKEKSEPLQRLLWCWKSGGRVC